MNKILIFGIVFFHFYAAGQQTTLQVVGKNLTLVNGETIVLRGVNYPFIDEGKLDMTKPVSYKAVIDEAAKTGANAIRISWYTNGTHWRDKAQFGTPGTMDSYVNNGHLSNAVAYCINKGMVAIIEIHDVTCTNNWSIFNTNVMNFWKSAAIQTLIQNNKSKIIINLANELGTVRWGRNPVSDLLAYKNNYNAAIASLRNLNINVPIMLDAPDCGQSSTEMLSVAESINTSDPRHNIIFSAHSYWGGYANTEAQIIAKLNEAQNTNVCFIIGELAKNQDNNSCGDLDLSEVYPIILQQACTRNIGWLAWSFSKDCNSARNMTANGMYANLTTFGNDIVHNPNYGLKSTTGCGASILHNQQFNMVPENVSVYPNPNSGRFYINSNHTITNISCSDILGKQIELQYFDSKSYQINNIYKGIYFIKIELNNNHVTYKKIVVN